MNLKIIKLLTLLVILTIPSYCFAGNNIIFEGYSIGDYKIGDNFLSIKASLGKPDAISEYKKFYSAAYDKYALEFLIDKEDGSTIIGIATQNPHYITYKGKISVGEDTKRLNRLYSNLKDMNNNRELLVYKNEGYYETIFYNDSQRDTIITICVIKDTYYFSNSESIKFDFK